MKKQLLFTTALCSLILSACSAPSQASQEMIITDHSSDQIYSAHIDDQGEVQKIELSGEEQEEQESSEASSSEEAESTDTDQGEEDQADQTSVYQQALEEYEKGYYDAAAGTLSLALENGLEEDADFQDLRDKIKEGQKEEVEGASSESGQYQLERHSQLAGQDFESAQSQDIQQASDSDIEEWKDESKVTVEKDDATSDEITAYEAVIEHLGIDPADYNFITTQESDQVYLVEVRQTQNQDDFSYSNLIGIFRYHTDDRQLEKMDMMTGNYEAL